AALQVADEAFLPVGGPGHGALQLAAGPGDQALLRIEEDLHAEAAANVAADHAQLRRTDLQHDVGDLRVHDVHALGRRVERRAVSGRIVVGDGRARLHRVDHDAVVDNLKLH